MGTAFFRLPFVKLTIPHHVFRLFAHLLDKRQAVTADALPCEWQAYAEFVPERGYSIWDMLEAVRASKAVCKSYSLSNLKITLIFKVCFF